MIDYESLILERQEEKEILLDECSGNCERCPYSEYVPPGGGWIVPEFFQTGGYKCNL